MPTPQFSAQISLGNVLTLLGLLIAGVAAFYQVQGNVQANRDAIARQQQLHAEMKQEVGQHEGRLRSVELEGARSEERLSNIFAVLSRIEARLVRIEGAGR